MGIRQHKRGLKDGVSGGLCSAQGFLRVLGHHKAGFQGDFSLGSFDEAEHSVESQTIPAMEIYLLV